MALAYVPHIFDQFPTCLVTPRAGAPPISEPARTDLTIYRDNAPRLTRRVIDPKLSEHFTRYMLPRY